MANNAVVFARLFAPWFERADQSAAATRRHLLTAFQPVSPQQAIQIVSNAGIADAARLIVDFAAAGLVKSYALVIDSKQDDGRRGVVRGGAILTDLWRRIVQQGVADEIWRGGTVRLGAVPAEAWPEVNITGVSFSVKSLQRLIEHHGAKALPSAEPLAAGSAQERVEGDGEPEVEPAPGRRRPDPSAFPIGAELATVNQAMAALGFGRTKINELMNDGRLVRVKVDGSTRITVESIRALAGRSRT